MTTPFHVAAQYNSGTAAVDRVRRPLGGSDRCAATAVLLAVRYDFSNR